MKKYGKWGISLLAAFLILLSGCGGRNTNQSDGGIPAASKNTTPVQREETPEKGQPEEVGEPDKDEPSAITDNIQEESDSIDTTPSDAQEEESSSQTTAPADVQPEEPAEPEPASEIGSEPQDLEEDSIPEDGSYIADVTLEGGTGRASVETPAELRCEDGKFWAVIVWSSPNFDYMKVDGVKYEQINTEGNSIFEIPVTAFDQKLDVIADTVAMSEPHEVEYTLQFDSSTLQKR